MSVNHRISWLPSFAWFPRHIFTGSWVIAGNIPWWIHTPGIMWLRSVPRLCRSATETWLESQRINKLLQRWARSYMLSRCCVNICKYHAMLRKGPFFRLDIGHIKEFARINNTAWQSWKLDPLPRAGWYLHWIISHMALSRKWSSWTSIALELPWHDKPHGLNGNQTWLTGKRSNGSPKFIQLEHHPQWGIFKQAMFDNQRVPLTTWDFTNLYGCLGPSRVKVHVWLDFIQVLY